MQKKKYFILTLIFLSILSLFYFNQKKGFHEDEIYSYGSSNYKYDNIYKSYGYTGAELDYFWNVTFKGNLFSKIGNSLEFLLNKEKKEYPYKEELLKKEPILKTKQEATEYMSLQKEDLGNYFSVWLNQAIDVHPPLFYFLVHFFSLVSFNHFSKLPIYLLNLVAFLLTLIAMKKILEKEKKEDFTLPAVILYGASMAGLSTLMFQRMYMLLTCFCTWYLYYLLKIDKEEMPKKEKIHFSLIITGGFLTQYYFCIYAVMSFVTYVFLNLKDKEKIKNLFFIHFKGTLLGLLLFPVSIYHILFSSRGIVGHENAIKTYFEMFKYFMTNLITKLNLNYILFGLLLLLLIYCSKKFKLLKKKEFHLLLFPSMLSLLVVSKISPFLGKAFTFRYIMFLYPSIVLFIFYCLSFMKHKKTPIVCLVLTIILSLYGLITTKPTYLYEDYQKSLDIANTYQNDTLIYVVDNDYTFLNAMPEFLTYKNHLIINKNADDLRKIKALEDVSKDKEAILCIKSWLDKENIKKEILENTSFTEAILLEDIESDVESVYYLLKKE